MIAKVCSQKNKNRDYFSSGWCIKTISATCCLHRDRLQREISLGARKHRRQHKEEHHIERGAQTDSAQCTLNTTHPHSASYQPVTYQPVSCTVYLLQLSASLAPKDIFACTLSLCKQQVALMVLMHQPLLK